jgi:hypothetical protein
MTIRLGKEDYEWVDEPARPPGGGDGALLPMTVPEWRSAGQGSRRGACASCGKAIRPGDVWLLVTECPHFVRYACDEACADRAYQALEPEWRKLRCPCWKAQQPAQAAPGTCDHCGVSGVAWRIEVEDPGWKKWRTVHPARHYTASACTEKCALAWVRAEAASQGRRYEITWIMADD